MKVIEVIIAILLIWAAIFNFEFYDFNKWLVSILLLLSAANLIFKREEFTVMTRKISWIILIVLVIKLVFIG